MSRTKLYWNKLEKEYGHLGDRAKCRICGRVYIYLGGHLKFHHLTEMEYKDKFEILHSLPLCVEEFSERRRKQEVLMRENKILITTDRFIKSKRNTGRKPTPGQIKAYPETMKRSPEVYEKIKAILKGNTWNKGRKKSSETREKLSIARKLYLKTFGNKLKGTHRTQETKDRISKAKKLYYEMKRKGLK